MCLNDGHTFMHSHTRHTRTTHTHNTTHTTPHTHNTHTQHTHTHTHNRHTHTHINIFPYYNVQRMESLHYMRKMLKQTQRYWTILILHSSMVDSVFDGDCASVPMDQSSISLVSSMGILLQMDRMVCVRGMFVCVSVCMSMCVCACVRSCVFVVA